MFKESIAIIGIGCRFPGANNLKDFWQLLYDGSDAITEAISDRHTGLAGWGGFLEGVDRFDTEFFRIPPQEAVTIDPQHRLLLEVTWEALEDAGQIPEHLAGTNTGVFVGISSHDYYKLVSQQAMPGLDVSTGNHECMVANRLSYYFDFRGPSLAINTACSSSLVAVDRACRSLWTGESTLAIAGGVNLIFSPEITARFTNAGLIAADGRCKAFDAKADGYVRSEGVGVVVLKPLSQAQADGDRIYAIIRGSAVNHNGRSNGLTAPNLQAQIDLLQQAYQQANIDPSSVDYVEAQGTATPIGDVLEMKALGSVVGKNRSSNSPCRVGSVKTNIGHTEAAAGIAGLIKVVLSLQHRQIPANLHFQQPNPAIAFEKLGLRVQQTLESLPEEVFPIRAGVSAFGFGGTNAHVVLEEAPATVKTEIDPSAFPLKILTLTAKSQIALRELASRYQTFLTNQPTVSLADICFTANTRRSQFKYRLAIIPESKEQLREQLSAFIQEKPLPSVFSSQVTSRKLPQIAFVFSGQTRNFSQIVRKLYNSQPNFRSCLDRCEAIVHPQVGKPLLEIIEAEYVESDKSHSQLVTFILEYAIAQLWQSWGVEPAIAIGYGTGQYVAATIAGILSLEAAISLIVTEKNLELLTPNFQPAKIPVISSVTGTVIKVKQTINSHQWQQQFSQSANSLSEIPKLLQDPNYILLEVSLSQIIDFQPNLDREQIIISSFSDTDIALFNLNNAISTLVKIWLMGVKVNWSNVGDYEQCHPISLPTYPFEHQSYWIATSPEIPLTTDKEIDNHSLPAPNQLRQESEATFLVPQDELELQLTQIWSKILGIQPIGIGDNFFDLGGNSLLMVRLSSEIQQTLGFNLSLATIFQASTVEQLANIIRQGEQDTSVGEHTLTWKSLVPIKPQGIKHPIFVIHYLPSQDLIHHLKTIGDYPIYALRYGLAAKSIETSIKPPGSVEELAIHYISELRQIQPEGPYFLIGHSLGGKVAFEMAIQLTNENQKIGFLSIIDTYFYSPTKPLFFHELIIDLFSSDGLKLFFKALVLKFKHLPLKIRNYAKPKQEERMSDQLNKKKEELWNPTILNGDIERRIHNNYEPKYYSGKLVYFVASSQRMISTSRKFLSFKERQEQINQMPVGSVEVYKIPTNHLTIMKDPWVGVVVSKLKIYLDTLKCNNLGEINAD